MAVRPVVGSLQSFPFLPEPMSTTTAASRPSPAVLYGVLAVWGLVAAAAGLSGALLSSPLPAPAFAIVLAVLSLLAIRFVPAIGDPVRALSTKTLVAVHLIRIVAGINFLVLAAQGVLPDAFAQFAGWGDLAVGLGAVAVLWLCLPLQTAAQRTGLLVWNVLGLLDILGVLGNGARLLAADPTIGAPFADLPLTLLPLFVVPLVIASHVLLFDRLRRAGSGRGATRGGRVR